MHSSFGGGLGVGGRGRAGEARAKRDGEVDWLAIFDERGGPDAEPDDDGRTMRSLLDDDFIDVLSLFFY